MDDQQLERFWSHVQRGPGCWPWTASKVRGYGQFYVRRVAGKSVRIYAHRLSYEIANGPTPDGLMVLHRCDNPPCVNPAHLYAGTAKDNSEDMYERRRNVSLLGRVRLDVTRRWVAGMREQGWEAASVNSDEIAGWMDEHRQDSATELGRYIDRISHGGSLPEQVA